MDDVFSSRFILEDSTVKGKEMKERNARISCKGTKAGCCPPVFTEASGIDVLPRLPIEQGASSVSPSSSPVRAISGLEVEEDAL